MPISIITVEINKRPAIGHSEVTGNPKKSFQLFLTFSSNVLSLGIRIT